MKAKEWMPDSTISIGMRSLKSGRRLEIWRSSMTVIVTGSHKAMLIGGYNNSQSWTTSLLRDVIKLVNIPDLWKYFTFIIIVKCITLHYQS